MTTASTFRHPHLFFNSLLRRFPACLMLLVRPPVRHIAAVAAVELLGNVVLTSGATTPIFLFGFHCLALVSNLFADVIGRHHCEVGNLGNHRTVPIGLDILPRGAIYE